MATVVEIVEILKSKGEVIIPSSHQFILMQQIIDNKDKIGHLEELNFESIDGKTTKVTLIK